MSSFQLPILNFQLPIEQLAANHANTANFFVSSKQPLFMFALLAQLAAKKQIPGHDPSYHSKGAGPKGLGECSRVG